MSRVGSPRDLLIRDGLLVDVTGSSRVVEHQDVAINGSRIVAVGPTGTLGDAERVIDAREHAILPGLVNCHSHAPMSLFRGASDAMPLHAWLAWVAQYGSRYDEEDVYWGALLAICQMLRAGVTTVADMYFRQDLVVPAVERSGIRAFLAEGVMDGSRDGLRGTSEQQMQRAEDLVRTHNGRAEGRIITGIAPHSVYGCGEGLLREVAQVARESRCRVHTHLSETAREVEECVAAHGRRPPRVMDDCGLFEGRALAAHAVHLDADDIALLAERGVAVSHNPASNLKLRSGVAPVAALRRAGIRVGLGTDSAGSNDALDLWRECFLAAVLQDWGDGVSPAAAALELATAGGAAALHLEDEIGALAPGMKADLVLVDLDRIRLVPATDVAKTLVFAVRGDEVAVVIVNGRVVVEEQRVLTVDEREVIEQCRRRARRIFGEGAIA